MEVANLPRLEENYESQWIELEARVFGLMEFYVSLSLKDLCETLGVDFKHMLWAVEQNALSGRRFHTNTDDYIDQLDFHFLAQQLHVGLHDLPLVQGSRESTGWAASIEALRDKYSIDGNSEVMGLEENSYHTPSSADQDDAEIAEQVEYRVTQTLKTRRYVLRLDYGYTLQALQEYAENKRQSPNTTRAHIRQGM
ncbi:MAG: hypothetical protein M1832_000101 [Thelocarpon impressellum]|nr:MAG: hypothetical protein M1832_000101 [Thelocarpon impressellum]